MDIKHCYKKLTYSNRCRFSWHNGWHQCRVHDEDEHTFFDSHSVAVWRPDFTTCFTFLLIHDFCTMLILFSNYLQILCNLEQGKVIRKLCLHLFDEREKKLMTNYKITIWSLFFLNKNAFQIFCLCQMAVILKQDIAKDRNVHDVFNVF